MHYHKIIMMKDGRPCVLRNGTEQDGQALLDNFILTHGETDFLSSYPEDIRITAEQEAQFLKTKAESADEIELLALVDGIVVGTAGIDHINEKRKEKHRAEFGISIAREYWGLGIGRALMRACVECAAKCAPETSLTAL